MQQRHRSHRHDKQHALSEGSVFMGVEEEVDHNQISGDIDHGCRSESMEPIHTRSLVSERLVESTNYSRYSAFSNPELVRFLPASASRNSQEYGLDIGADIGISRKSGISEALRQPKAPSEGEGIRLHQRNCIAPTALDFEFSTNEIERHGNTTTVSMYPQNKILSKSQSDRSIMLSPSDVRIAHGTANQVCILKDQDEVSPVNGVTGSRNVRESFEVTRSNTKGGKRVVERERAISSEIERNGSGHSSCFEVTAVNAVTGSRNVRESFEVTRSNAKGGKRVVERERAISSEIERSGSGHSSCFGRVISCAKCCSSEGSKSSSENMSQDSPSRKWNAASQACGKNLSRHSLRNFSCISSSDVFPTETKSSMNSAPNHIFDSRKLGTHNINHKSVFFHGMGNNKCSVVKSAGCMVRRKLQSGLGVMLPEQGAANKDLSPAPSVRPTAPALKANKRSLMRPTSITSGTVLVNSMTESSNSALQASNVRSCGGSREISRMSTESIENTSRETIIDGQMLPQRLVQNNIRGEELYGKQSGPTEMDRRDTPGLWLDSALSRSMTSSRHEGHNASSSIFSGSPSTSRVAQMPSLHEMSPHTRSPEVTSSSSSYTSSPDAQFSNSGMPCSYASTLQCPNFSRAVSSPEYSMGYQIHAAETPVYGTFGQFPLRSFQGNQMCLTFEGLSEMQHRFQILSAQEHVERDEISHEQLFMLEANLLFGGMASHDQHRDLRLDVDNMSYEELLALEERIGSVCTGLERDAISGCLKSKKYSFTATTVNAIPNDSEFKCSICQEEFEKNVELGILDCGHKHHFLCIEQWLLQKNLCPICKAPASS